MKTKPDGLRGYITDGHLDLAEVEFPGITRFYRECVRKPATFLDLMSWFEHSVARSVRC